MTNAAILTYFFIFEFVYIIQLVFIVIQTTEGRKNLGSILVYVAEILRFALNDIGGITHPESLQSV